MILPDLSLSQCIQKWIKTGIAELQKQQILKNQSMANELKKLWSDKENPAFINKTLDIMEKYFEK